MSTYFRLVDKENKIMMNAGKADKDSFMETAEEVKEKFVPLTYWEGLDKLYNLDAKKLKDVEVEDIRVLLNLIEAIKSFDTMGTIYLSTLFYFIDVIDAFDLNFDYICEYDEEKMEKYKDYKYLRRYKAEEEND